MKRARILLVTLGCCLALAIVGWTGANGFIRSDAFRNWIERRVSHSLRADGRLEPLTWEGATFHSPGYSAQGSGKSKLTSLHASNLTAHLGWPEFLTRALVINELSVGKLDLLLGKKRSPVLTQTPPKNSFHLPSLSANLRVDKIRVEQADLHWKTNRGEPGDLLATMVVASRNGPASWQFSATGGTARQANHPAINIDSVSGKFDENAVTIDQAKFRTDAGGDITLRGASDLRDQLMTKVHTDFAGIDLASLLPQDWTMTGLATGKFDYTGSLDHIEEGDLLGSIQIANAKFDALTVFGKLRPLTEASGLTDFSLDSVSANIHYQSRHTEFSNFVARYRDQMRIEGSGTIDGGQIDANLVVGFSPRILNIVPGASEKVFTEERDGLRWTTMRISGPLRQPKEDLSKRLLKAMQERMTQDLKSNLKDAAKSLLDLLGH